MDQEQHCQGSHQHCGCTEAQWAVRQAIADLRDSRGRLNAALIRLKQVDKDARNMTTTDSMVPGATSPWNPSPETLRQEQTWYPGGTTDSTLLAAALEQASREVRVQAEMIDVQGAALRLAEETLANVKQQLASLQRDYQSLADRFAENWPTNTEMARMRTWLTDLTAALGKEQASAALWQERYFALYQNFSAGDRSAVLEPRPSPEPIPVPATAMDDEMLG
jgi:hypothetical protein